MCPCHVCGGQKEFSHPPVWRSKIQSDIIRLPFPLSLSAATSPFSWILPLYNNSLPTNYYFYCLPVVKYQVKRYWFAGCLQPISTICSTSLWSGWLKTFLRPKLGGTCLQFQQLKRLRKKDCIIRSRPVSSTRKTPSKPKESKARPTRLITPFYAGEFHMGMSRPSSLRPLFPRQFHFYFHSKWTCMLSVWQCEF